MHQQKKTLGAVLEPEFHTLLETARQRAVIRKHNTEESDGPARLLVLAS
jgi:hypothetical protein